MTEILRLENLQKRFGALTVTDGVSLALDEGEALGIIGPNGAGKTTLFNLITGDHYPNEGKVFLEGEEITSLPPALRCWRGVGRSYQIPLPFISLTVFENLLVGANFGASKEGLSAHEFCYQILEQTGLLPKANKLAGSLSLLERKRLEMARALATNPKLLLLDEIAGGLTEHEVHELVASIKEIKAKGISIIWIEHIVHALVAVVDHLAVIHLGQLLTQGQPDLVMKDPQVQEIYMGISLE